MTQRIDDFDKVRQILDSLEAQITAALADDEADTELIASQQAQIDKLRSDAEWRENSRKSYIQAHNAAVKALGLPLPKPNGGGAYTPEEIIAAASAQPGQPAKPTTPSTAGGRVFSKRSFDPKTLPANMQALYASSKRDMRRQLDGPMAKAKRYQTPHQADVPYLQDYDMRYVGHALFQPLWHNKAFGEVGELKEYAELFTAIVAQMPTDNGPKCKSVKMLDVFSSANKLLENRAQKGLRRMWRKAPGKDYDESDWSGLEKGIYPGVFASAYVAFNDLREVDPAFAEAADTCLTHMLEIKERMTVLTAIMLGAGKPWWMWNHTVWHALCQYCLYLYVLWRATGDDSARQGYEYYAKLLQAHVVYADSSVGEIVNYPHQPVQRGRDLGYTAYRDTERYPADLLGYAGDFTYPETAVEALTMLYWLGVSWVTPRLMAGIARTFMNACFPEGFKVGSMSEAICGSSPKSLDGQHVVSLFGGKEIVETPGITADKTTTRQANAAARRAGQLSPVVFTGDTRYLPALADLAAQQPKNPAKACDTWALMLRAQIAKYPVLERLA